MLKTPYVDHSFANASDWNEGLRRYREKKSTPVYAEMPKVERVTRREKALEETAFNPITQQYVVQEKEMERTQEFKQALTSTINSAKDKQLRTETQYDIINFATRQPGLPQPDAKRPSPHASIGQRSRADFDIISNQMRTTSAEVDTTGAASRVPVKPSRSMAMRREYDVISNKFFKDHDEREVDEYNASLERGTKEFWRTRNFDPVTCRYYDSEKEAYYRELREEAKKNHGHYATDVLPPSLKYRETLFYDIATGVVRDPVKLAELEEGEAEALRVKREKKGTEDRIKRDRLREIQAKDDRAVNRIAVDRYTDSVKRGYDIISTETINEHIGKMPPPPRTKAPPTLNDIAAAQTGVSKIRMGVQVPARAASASTSAPASSLPSADHRRSSSASNGGGAPSSGNPFEKVKLDVKKAQ
mmetsp:Transcript_43428/g.113023  ORF Transcript_43428/g.113023 Transcript_43428/m.113023 type:complete len:417 (-) Transcript_43428:419-1669(-)